MRIELTKCSFIDAFRAYDRYDQFGYEALSALYDYLDDIDPDYGLDVIAICCDWAVYDSALSAYAELVNEAEEISYHDALEYLRDNMTIIELDNNHLLVQSC